MTVGTQRASARRTTGAGFLLFLVLAVVGWTLLPVSSDAQTVLLPMVVAGIFLAWFILRLTQLSGTTPIADVGAWYTVAGTVYLLLPLAVFLGLGMVFIPTSDGRLFALQPDPAEVARIAWMYVVHISAFGFTYVALHGRDRALGLPEVVSRRTIVVALSLFLILSSFLYATRLVMQPETYADSFAVIQALPLAAKQAIKFVFGVNFVLTILLLVAAFENYKKWRSLILAWLAFQLVMTVALGARSGLVASVCACIILYHLRVRRIGTARAALFAVVTLVGFLGLGVLRSYPGSERAADFTVPLNGGEFEALFANAVDIDRRHRSGEIDGAPPGAYLADFVAPIPSQLLPFEKQELAVWYVSRFYPAAYEAGAGYAFGVIAQSAVGYGWIELVVRGIVLGYVLAKIHRLFRSRGGSLWIAVLYIWLIVNAYQSFRNTTFSTWTYFVQNFIPAFIIVESLAAIFGRVSTLSRLSTKNALNPTSP